MVANTQPIFTNIPQIMWGTNAGSVFITSAVIGATVAAAYDGTSGAILVFSGDATDGSFLQKIICEPGPGNNVASVVRVILNNGQTFGTATNNALLMSYSLPATTASAGSMASHIEIPINLQIPASYRVYVVLAAGSAIVGGWSFIGVGGTY